MTPPPAHPPEAWPRAAAALARTHRAASALMHQEATGGILLIIAAALAMAWANSPWAASYEAFWSTPLGLRVGGFAFERSLSWFVNDGLMAIFFFVVGLEIRREIHDGELSQWRRASLPVAAAVGGMLVPAALYLLVAGAPAARSGWGIAMATDIAFAVGILSLLGKRAPPTLRILLLAVAVIDDLGAVLVIAVFYSAGISAAGVSLAVAGVAVIVLMRGLGVRNKLAYVAPAVVTWAGVYAAGVHPTVAGVLVGLLTPVRPGLGMSALSDALAEALSRMRGTGDVADALRGVDVARREARDPGSELIERLHPWVTFAVMPVFALANAGVTLADISIDAQSWGVAAGVTLGLLLGKPLGILGAAALAIRLGVARLPQGLGTRHLLVLGAVAGIGFTMALFIGQLAFEGSALLGAAKLGVLAASGIAAVLALVLGRVLLRAPPT